MPYNPSRNYANPPNTTENLRQSEHKPALTSSRKKNLHKLPTQYQIVWSELISSSMNNKQSFYHFPSTLVQSPAFRFSVFLNSKIQPFSSFNSNLETSKPDFDSYRELRSGRKYNTTSVHTLCDDGSVEDNRASNSSKKQGGSPWNSHIDPRSGQWPNQWVHRPTNSSARAIDSAGSRNGNNIASEPLPQGWLKYRFWYNCTSTRHRPSDSSKTTVILGFYKAKTFY